MTPEKSKARGTQELVKAREAREQTDHKALETREHVKYKTIVPREHIRNEIYKVLVHVGQDVRDPRVRHLPREA